MFDFGSSSSKVGYSGEDLPRSVFSSLVGSYGPDSTNISKKDREKVFVGDQQIYKWRPGMELQSPFTDGGLIDNWDLLQNLWDHSYHSVLHVDPKEHPLLFCEPSWNTKELREKLCEVAFESYGVPAFYLGRSASLAAFASGRPSALVVDCGSTMTSVVPVHDGYVCQQAIERAPLGGDFVSAQVEHYLTAQKGIKIVPQYKVLSKKPVDCGATADYVAVSRPNTTDSFHRFAVEGVLHEFKQAVAHVHDTQLTDINASRKAPKNYEFPNGYNAIFSGDRFSPAEGLFDASRVLNPSSDDNNSNVTIKSLIHSSVAKCDVDLRNLLYGNVVITGGGSMLPGFADRLYHELHIEAPNVIILIPLVLFHFLTIRFFTTEQSQSCCCWRCF